MVLAVFDGKQFHLVTQYHPGSLSLA